MIKLDHLSKKFIIRKNWQGKEMDSVYALNDVSFNIPLGMSTGVVGESGSGKSTLARMLLGLIDPTHGYFKYKDFNSSTMNDNLWRQYRRKVQMVFQDPYGSLNPRLNIQKILEEPLIIHKKYLKFNKQERKDKIIEIVKSVGLPLDCLVKFPHEFSGGQRQRVGIARSLILKPEVLVLDEPVSALDVSIQAQVLNLLLEIKNSYKMTFVFIAHDLSVVSYISQKVVVMYFGKLMEYRDTSEIFSNPINPYTKLLIDAMPTINKKRKKTISVMNTGNENGSIKISTDGCPFFNRCPKAVNECRHSFPERTFIDKTNFYHCHNP